MANERGTHGKRQGLAELEAEIDRQDAACALATSRTSVAPSSGCDRAPHPISNAFEHLSSKGAFGPRLAKDIVPQARELIDCPLVAPRVKLGTEPYQVFAGAAA